MLIKNINYYCYLSEIKNRFFLFLITTLSVVFTVYTYKEILIFILCVNKPFFFIHTNITEIFSTYMKLVLFLTNQICFIYFFFHIFIFLTPGLYKNEYKLLITFFYISSVAFIFAIFFLNLVLLPLSFEFFLSFQNSIISKSLNFYFEAKIENYFYFYITLYYICQFYCQLFIFLLNFFYYYDNKLEKVMLFRKLFYFLFCCLFFSTIFFSDILLQIFLCLCTVINYEFILFYFFVKKTWGNIFLKKTKNYSNYK